MSTNQLVSWFKVRCPSCDARTGSCYESLAEAVEVWNRRAPSTSAAAPAPDLATARNMLVSTRITRPIAEVFYKFEHYSPEHIWDELVAASAAEPADIETGKQLVSPKLTPAVQKVFQEYGHYIPQPFWIELLEVAAGSPMMYADEAAKGEFYVSNRELEQHMKEFGLRGSNAGVPTQRGASSD